MTSKRQSLEIETLRELLPPGSTVFCILRFVSRSGMSREISFLTGAAEGGLRDVTGLFGIVGEYRRGNRDGLKVSGCGMDMGFSVVYDVSRRLYPDGFGVVGEGPLGHEIRPDTREHAAKAVEVGVKFYGRNGDASGWDNDGGYALKSRWI